MDSGELRSVFVEGTRHRDSDAHGKPSIGKKNLKSYIEDKSIFHGFRLKVSWSLRYQTYAYISRGIMRQVGYGGLVSEDAS